jgi:hypothetical protein
MRSSTSAATRGLSVGVGLDFPAQRLRHWQTPRPQHPVRSGTKRPTKANADALMKGVVEADAGKFIPWQTHRV